MTLESVAVGRALFFSRQLSKDASLSCADCHSLNHAFADPRVVPLGIFGDPLLRNSPSLFNSAWASYLTWSNLALHRLEDHALVPLFGDTPPELAATFRNEWLTERVQHDPAVIDAAMRESEFLETQTWTWTYVLARLGDYQRSLISFDAPWDAYQRGEQGALSGQAQRGLELFFSDELGCASCHPPPFFSTAYSGRRGESAKVEQSFANTGLYRIESEPTLYPPKDPGIFEFTGEPTDVGRFRIPSLRNVELTAPYMHDGSIDSLERVVEHYAAGGRRIDVGPLQGDGSMHPNKDPRVNGFKVTPEDRDALVSFLKALTGHEAQRLGSVDDG